MLMIRIFTSAAVARFPPGFYLWRIQTFDSRVSCVICQGVKWTDLFDDARRFFCTGISTNSCTAGSSRLTIEPKLSSRNTNASSKPRKAKAEKVPAEPKRAPERRRKTRIINDRTPRRSPTAKPCRACAAVTTRSEDTPFFFGSLQSFDIIDSVGRLLESHGFTWQRGLQPPTLVEGLFSGHRHLADWYVKIKWAKLLFLFPFLCWSCAAKISTPTYFLHAVWRYKRIASRAAICIRLTPRDPSPNAVESSLSAGWNVWSPPFPNQLGLVITDNGWSPIHPSGRNADIYFPVCQSGENQSTGSDTSTHSSSLFCFILSISGHGSHGLGGQDTSTAHGIRRRGRPLWTSIRSTWPRIHSASRTLYAV